ncbi:Alpha-galactosidase 2 [Purpureocillium lavendulum]|uniref:Alpha-galactosidase 2 n=1 Tax=Purpureocillium lavendulum TaxID=1247861 RepID=A0AB34FD78_9HYPO|nr:Alpha-galactosidase 2 [Purpureocillium lavendulum]
MEPNAGPTEPTTSRNIKSLATRSIAGQLSHGTGREVGERVLDNARGSRGFVDTPRRVAAHSHLAGNRRRFGLERFKEATVKRQLERWSVRCPLCLLYRDTACHGHTLSSCPKSEGKEARGLRGRLWEGIVELQYRGFQGYGPVPWCGNCLLPKSACPAWTTRIPPEAYADPREGRVSQDQAVEDGSRCAFREVVVDALSAVMSFSGPPTDMAMGGKSFRAHVEAWRGSSAIRFNRHMGLEGWLLSPARWGEQDVAVMLRVFCHLDAGVEDMWIEKEVAQRRAALAVDVVRPPSPALCGSTDDGTDDLDPEEEQRLRIHEALQYAKNQREQASMSGGYYSFTLNLRKRLAAWYKGGVRCQLCLMYEWSEVCYLHDMEECQMRPEAQRARSLLNQWSDLRGAEGGTAECCPGCRFPLFVCRLAEDGASGESERDGRAGACNWMGARVMVLTVASLLTARKGILGEAVIRKVRREKDWNGRVEDLSRDWMAEQIVVTDGLTVPRIVEVFQRLLDGFGGLGSRVTTHLRDKHDIPEDARKGLTSFLKALPGPPLREPDEAPPRTDGSEEHILLRVYDGFSCRSCAFRTISIQSMRRHFSDSAGRQCPAYGTAQDRRAIEALFDARVARSDQPTPKVFKSTCGPSTSENKNAMLIWWIVGTQKLQDAIGRPSLSSGLGLKGQAGTRRDDRVLGLRGLCGLREDLVSPFEDEQKIGAILGLVDELMDRCEETARKTSRSILCWLRSTRALTPYSKPFTLVRQHTSTVKYRTLLKKCLAMVFRAYRMAPDVRQKATGIRLKKKHMSYMESIWNDAAVAILVQREESLRRDGPCRDAKEEELSDKRGATERELGHKSCNSARV